MPGAATFAARRRRPRRALHPLWRTDAAGGGRMTAAASIISVKDVRVHFRIGIRGETVKAVDGVSFDIAEGDTLGIIGESGSGKSTLARVLVALLAPTAGTVLQDGRNPYELPPEER